MAVTSPVRSICVLPLGERNVPRWKSPAVSATAPPDAPVRSSSRLRDQRHSAPGPRSRSHRTARSWSGASRPGPPAPTPRRSATDRTTPPAAGSATPSWSSPTPAEAPSPAPCSTSSPATPAPPAHPPDSTSGSNVASSAADPRSQAATRCGSWWRPTGELASSPSAQRAFAAGVRDPRYPIGLSP